MAEEPTEPRPQGPYVLVSGRLLGTGVRLGRLWNHARHHGVAANSGLAMDASHGRPGRRCSGSACSEIAPLTCTTGTLAE
jgi:hypothetical protein